MPSFLQLGNPSILLQQCLLFGSSILLIHFMFFNLIIIIICCYSFWNVCMGLILLCADMIYVSQ